MNFKFSLSHYWDGSKKNMFQGRYFHKKENTHFSDYRRMDVTDSVASKYVFYSVLQHSACTVPPIWDSQTENARMTGRVLLTKEN